MATCRVAIAKNDQALAAVRQAVELLGGVNQFIRPGDRVFIKPNHITPCYTRGTTTSAEVTAAVALLVKEAGARPVIGEFGLCTSHAKIAATDTCAHHCTEALAAVGLAGEVPLVNLNADEMVPVKLPQAQVLTETKIAKAALEADKIIDIPVLKTHDQVWATLAIKNLKGLIPIDEKKRSHALGVDQAIVDLCQFLPPTLVILDAMTAAEGMGPTGGTPVTMNLILAGGNALAVDMAGVAVMGLNARQIKYLKNAIRRGVGPQSLDEVEIAGLPIESVRRPFVTAESIIRKQYEEMGIHVVSHNVCSGCWAEFRHIYYSLGEDRTKLSGTTFVLGSPDDLPPDAQKVIVLGKCASALAARGRFVPGCPPEHEKIEAAAREVAGIPKTNQ